MHDFSILRKESFGGTLGNAVSGKRVYITQSEYREIEETGEIPSNILLELGTKCTSVKIYEPDELLSDNFSAPDIVYFEMTRSCNLVCTHCLNCSGEQIKDEMSNEKRLELLDQFMEFGVQEIRFTGGEPLMIPQVFEYISKVRKNGLRATIGTNGTLINRDVSLRLKESGLNVAVVSVDGLENRHDAIRGSGTFKETLKGIDLLRSYGIKVRINIVAMKSNLTEIPYVVQCAFDRGISIMIRRFILSGRAAGSNESLSSEDYLWLRNKLGPLLNDHRKLVKGHHLIEDEMVPRIRIPFGWCKCKAGRRGLAVMPDGVVYTCGFLPTIGIPNVGDLKYQRLKDIWRTLNVSATNCFALAMTNQKDLVQIRKRLQI